MSNYYEKVYCLDELPLKDILEMGITGLLDEYGLHVFLFLSSKIGEEVISQSPLEKKVSELLKVAYQNLKEKFDEFKNHKALMDIVKKEMKSLKTDDENFDFKSSKRDRSSEEIDASLQTISRILFENDSSPKKKNCDESMLKQLSNTIVFFFIGEYSIPFFSIFIINTNAFLSVVFEIYNIVARSSPNEDSVLSGLFQIKFQKNIRRYRHHFHSVRYHPHLNFRKSQIYPRFNSKRYVFFSFFSFSSTKNHPIHRHRPTLPIPSTKINTPAHTPSLFKPSQRRMNHPLARF